MSAVKTIPDVPAPAWATEATEWESELDGTAHRHVKRPLTYDIVNLEAFQTWNPITGQVTLNEQQVTLEGWLYEGDGKTLAEEARGLAARLLEAADLLDREGGAL
ncbi:hypothetical protein RN607_05495 [Demequina capsici]|uniref:Uncharacterized protein n=1 Tax=Demequina capsici TaxID=3075620 RepID=A0AA96JDU2_9MICO|nr:hypothetical protein [Demequina sp. PMTSA13]WNM28456.1 hypothetical protein RN607_05495 [Demequina sp. PMTSA13]